MSVNASRRGYLTRPAWLGPHFGPNFSARTVAKTPLCRSLASQTVQPD